MKEKGCKVEGCDGKHFGKGYCQRHHWQIRHHGKIIKTRIDWGGYCNVAGCKGKVKAKGFCSRHWSQMHTYGYILERTMHDKNEIIINKDIAYIQLYDRDCKPIEKAIIDNDDVDKCKDYKWSLTAYGYVTARVEGKRTLLHNFVMNRNGSLKIQLDHKNRKPLDCRKSNLRICTCSENKYNIAIRTDNTSGFRGVYLDKRSNKWIAEIVANNQHYPLGRFDDKVEAARTRDRAALELHGEFAYLNFPAEKVL